MGQMIIILVGVILATGCRRARMLDEPVARDLVNARLENGTECWRFAFGEHSGKTRGDGGINDSACVVLIVDPNQQLDCFSQTILPLGTSECQLSAYVRATGTNIKARIRLECIDPEQSFNNENYGQLADADSKACPTTGEWVLLTTTVTIPERTKQIKVFGSVDGTDGTAYLDDFQVVRR